MLEKKASLGLEVNLRALYQTSVYTCQVLDNWKLVIEPIYYRRNCSTVQYMIVEYATSSSSRRRREKWSHSCSHSSPDRDQGELKKRDNSIEKLERAIEERVLLKKSEKPTVDDAVDVHPASGDAYLRTPGPAKELEDSTSGNAENILRNR
ncbi:unnamed protein product, partial [Didymodactylos carnosus]